MAVKIPQNEEISGGGKSGGRKGLGSALHQRRVNRGSINIKKEIEEELFSEILTQI